MLKGFILSPDTALGEDLQAALATIGQVAVVRRLERYPSEFDLVRLIRAHAPQVMFVHAGAPDEALALAAQVEGCAPGIQIVGFDRGCNPRTLLELMRAGIREFLVPPFEGQDLPAAIDRLRTIVDQRPPDIESTNNVFAFLPAKPGVGCSTVALNASVALAALGPDLNVLLADFDLTCGIIGFMLRLNGPHSIVEAAEHAAELDENLWPKLVYSAGKLDVLPAGRLEPGFRIEPVQVRYLLDFARRNYKVICVDLSGLMERFSLDLMQEVKRIYMVCTPELAALHLAREKLDYLRHQELEDRVSLILNRSQKRALIPTREIEKIVGLPVMVELPNDYRGVHSAVTAARPVNASSDLGKCFEGLARKMMAKDKGVERRRRFVDYFSLVPAQYSFLPDSKKQ